MRSFQPHRIALAVGTAVLIGWQAPVHASIIKYDYTGLVSGNATCTRPLDCGTTPVSVGSGTAFSGNVMLDTATNTVLSFHLDLAGFGIWEGSGGAVNHGPTFLNFRLGTNAGATYTAKGLTAGSLFSMTLIMAGSSAGFKDFVDGYATTFTVPSIQSHFGSLSFGGAWSGIPTMGISSLTGTVQTTPTVDEPGTVALAGLAGLAALGAARRRKAAAAA